MAVPLTNRPPAFQRPAIMRIQELRRTGAGTLEDGLVKFEWSGPNHSSMQGTLDLELMVKTVRKEMPGSNEVVEQVLSSTWQPFEMSGEWDDKWAGRGFAMGMYNDFSQFVARAPLVRMTLDKHSLVGILTNLKIKYQKESKISWTITMSPHANESFEDPALVTDRRDRVRKPIDQWWQTFKAQLDAMTALRKGVGNLPLRADVLSTFDTLLAKVNSVVDQLSNIATNGLQGSDTERDLLRVSSTFRRIRGAGLEVTYGIQKQSNTVDVAYQDVIGTLKYDEWTNTTITALWRSTGLARQAEIDMQSRLGLNPIAIYRPKKRESLERISVKFYGTPDNWTKIYDGNHLKSRVLDGTEELLIPRLAA